MEKLCFMSDYTEGAHEKILERLIETNRVSVSGYGADPYCASAADKIKEACRTPDAAVYFLTGAVSEFVRAETGFWKRGLFRIGLTAFLAVFAWAARVCL